MIPWLAMMLTAQGAELHTVRQGEQIEAIAAELGAPELADAIRTANGIPPLGQPTTGQLLTLPTRDGVVEQQAFMVSIAGTATVDGEPAVIFDQLATGATVCTGARSYATVRLATQCTTDGANADDIHLFPETCIRVRSAAASPKRRSTVVDVTEGGISVQGNGNAAGEVTVVTPAGTTTGTEGGYRVTVEDNATRTEALTAAVAVQAQGEEVGLDAGQGSRTIEGEAPSAPVDLLVPGDLLFPAAGDVLKRPSFRWSEVEMAMGYRLEIATDPGFGDLVYQVDEPANTHTPTLLMLPFRGEGLWWRVASFDRFGFLGVPSDPHALQPPRGVGP